MDFSIKNNGEKTVAEYVLKPNDRIDNLTLGMLVNNNIEGIIPVEYIQGDNKCFDFDITGMVSLEEYLGDVIKKDKLLNLFYKIALVLRGSSEYMINWTSFVLETADIYIKDEAEVGLICVPLLSVSNDGNTCSFFKQILFSAQFDLEENQDYVGRLITFLNPKTYILDKFIYELEEMLQIEHKVFDIIEEDEDSEIGEEAETEEQTEEKAVAEKISETDENAEVIEEIEETVAEEKESETGGNAESEAAKTTEETVAEGEVLEDRESPETEAAKPAEEFAVEEVQEANEYFIAKEQEETAGYEAEEVLEDSDAEKEDEKETVQQTRPVVEGVPFLVRVKTGEIISIDKEVFTIGKDKEIVDYCIEDNKLISDVHAFIKSDDGDYLVMDNESESCTYMNNVELQPLEDMFMPHGTHIRLGNEEFIFKLHK